MSPDFASARPILVSGPPRSGVSLVASRLAAHPSARLLDAAPLAAEWLELVLAGGQPDGPFIDRLELAFQEAHGPDAGEGIQHLVVGCPQLLGPWDMAERLAASPLARRGALVLVDRDPADCVCSLARFPHLHPGLADPWSDRQGFLDAAARLVEEARSRMDALAAVGMRSAWVRYESLVTDPASTLSELMEALGLPLPGEPSAAGVPDEPSLHGISPSLCFRERPLDQASIGRWQRQLNPEEASALHPDGTEDSHAGRKPVPPPSPPGRDPLIATGRGGSGTRLLSDVLLQLGVHLGDRLNPTGDSIQWADLLYEMALGHLQGHRQPWSGSWRQELQHRARWLCGSRPASRPWGFKLPEAMLVPEALLEAWPGARLIHLVRHPLDTCLRRTHMTSRSTNPIGRATLEAAYRELGLADNPATEEPHLRNAASWLYQLQLLRRARDRYPERVLDLRYEDLCDRPQQTADALADELGLPRQPVRLNVETGRRRRWSPGDGRIEEVWQICGVIAETYGYRAEEGLA